MSLDGLIVAFGIVAFFALVVLFATPGLVSKIFDGLLRCFFGYRDIRKPDGRLYLRRFYITPRSWLGYNWKRGRSRWPRVLGWVPVTYRKIFVHHILLSDERTPHDHPWDFTTRILAGMYVEHIGTQAQRARCGSFGSVLRNHAGHVHALEIIRPVWSLVLAGESRRVWGFWSYSDELGPQWTDWRTFLKCPGAPTEPEDEIDPRRYPDASAADLRFFLDSLNYRWKAVMEPEEVSIPIAVEDEISTRKMVVSCPLPPSGWYCTRGPGHAGPCAALPTDEET